MGDDLADELGHDLAAAAAGDPFADPSVRLDLLRAAMMLIAERVARDLSSATLRMLAREFEQSTGFGTTRPLAARLLRWKAMEREGRT